MPKRKTAMTYPAVEKMLLGWPGVGTVEFIRTAVAEGEGQVLHMGEGGRRQHRDRRHRFRRARYADETQGEVFYVTEHYRNSRYVLMRLSKADPGTVEAFLRRRWFAVAPKKLHAAFGRDTQMTAETPIAGIKGARVKPSGSGPDVYLTTPEINPGLRRGWVMVLLRKQRALRPV